MCEVEFEGDVEVEEDTYSIENAIICEDCYNKIKTILTKPASKDIMH